MRRLSVFLLSLICTLTTFASEVSVAGLIPVSNSGRKVWNFNNGWLFMRGDAQGAEAVGFDDSKWQTVSTPHTAQLMPAEDSGCRNYQGIVWYRKHFKLPKSPLPTSPGGGEILNTLAGGNTSEQSNIQNNVQNTLKISSPRGGREGAVGSFVLHFEAIMGKQKFYVNGKLIKEHEGGYLPVNINLTEAGVKPGDDCVIAVMADNSDDKTYPPGKTQMTLDFCYHGGIYRDVWLIERPAVYITDNIDAAKVADGGIFVHYANITEKSAEVYANVNVRNSLSTQQTVTVQCTLTDANGKKVKQWQQKVKIPAGEDKTVTLGSKISNPHLWSPEDPYLYTLTARVINNSLTHSPLPAIPEQSSPTRSLSPGGGDILNTLADGNSSVQNTSKNSSPRGGREGAVTDAGALRIGIRSFEFRGKEGFWLNGKRYRQFVGANRHQDFAYVGNAMPNSQQWRDVQRLKDANFNIIRTAHYPQDPSFMQACDELGIFIIVATPGWQFWNKSVPEFAAKVHQNTRDIIRRDRNHPCVLMWEPILNETRYPESFALEALQITRDEYPYPYRPVAAADLHSAGVLENYDLIYAWPGDDEEAAVIDRSQRPGAITSLPTGKAGESLEARCIELNKNMFTREFGEYVDDWYAHNNLNRASRSWGERPMLMQALTLSNTTADQHRTAGLFLGGALWHPFDHQRGYHPDPYWGGIYDAFRQPKTAYYMFHSQIPVDRCWVMGDGGMSHPSKQTTNTQHLTPNTQHPTPFVYIANEMTQFSDDDVVVFSNCDSVRLTAFDGAVSWTLPVKHEKVLTDMGETDVKPYKEQMRNDDVAPYNAPVIFKDVWNFWKGRSLSYKPKNWQGVSLVAEGIIDGKVVTTTKRMPSRRSTKLRMYVDDRGKQLVADGSDFVVVICEVTDDSGNVRRLAKEEIKFTIDGPAEIIGEHDNIGANPRQVEWGSAPILVRSTTTAGKIKIHADVIYPGTHSPTPADIELESIPCSLPLLGSTKTTTASATAPKASTTAPKASASATVSKASASDSHTKLTDAEKQKMLQEVQDQQADFGVTH